MNDFERVAAVIRHLDQHHLEQPGLAELAAACGLSESHFHRLFRRWAAITPKDFLQCLTVEHAKQRLRNSASVLDTALDAGLSGPGRLHDLFVSIEAASPGEFKSGGRGLRIAWGLAGSPFGWCSVGWNARGICHMAFHESADVGGAPRDLAEQWPNAELRRDDTQACRRAKIIFDRESKSGGPLKLFVRGTSFQLKVWRALLRIPEGAVWSYRDVATAIGKPKAARAVGAACGSNSIALLIPCHRVIRETGVIAGYRWGGIRKRALLARESAQSAVAQALPPKVTWSSRSR